MSDDEAVDEGRSGRDGRRGRRGRDRRGPGLAPALAGAALLVVLGFALGVVGGLVMEEPDLLLDYVLGRAEPVAVGGEPAAAPDVAARPPGAGDAAWQETAVAVEEPAAAPAGGEEAATDAVADEVVVDDAPVAGSPAAPEPAPAEALALAAPPPGGGFAVQVGAFADAAAAEQLARRLRAHGHPVYVAPAAGSDAARWRVRVGPLSSRAEAEGVAARLERDERLSTWVLAESPR